MTIPRAKGLLKKIDGLLKKKDPGPIPGAKSILREISESVVKKADDSPKAKKGKGQVQFYWQYEDWIEHETPVFAITPKEYFDRTGAMSDQGYGSEDFPEGSVPEGFYELQESEFEFDGTRKEAEALLRADPHFEEKKMLGPDGLIADQR
jgi:hypothetical protein